MSDPGVEALRVEVCVARGLDARAAAFVSGETLAQLEESADRLVALIDARREEEPTTTDYLAHVMAATRRRKVAVTEMFAGGSPAPQARDERGRYASSFDGGARRPVSAARDPEREHGQLLGQLLGASRSERDANF